MSNSYRLTPAAVKAFTAAEENIYQRILDERENGIPDEFFHVDDTYDRILAIEDEIAVLGHALILKIGGVK